MSLPFICIHFDIYAKLKIAWRTEWSLIHPNIGNARKKHYFKYNLHEIHKLSKTY